MVAKDSSGKGSPFRMWALELLEQVKKAPGLSHLTWAVLDISVLVQMSKETLAEDGCWPALCELRFRDKTRTDQDLLQLLRSLPSLRLTTLELMSGITFVPLTYNCLREMYFGHL